MKNMVSEMENKINRPECYKELFSGTGNECKMCGMVLRGKGIEFCCEECRIKYVK